MIIIAMFVCTAISIMLYAHANKVDRGVKSGVKKIEMGEGITGASYQIAVSQVFAFLFALLATILLCVSLGMLETK